MEGISNVNITVAAFGNEVGFEVLNRGITAILGGKD